jgi:hypothetical protein
MRILPLLAIALLGVPTLTYADTILVGTDLSTATHGGAAVLCPSVADCTDRASQFTLSTSVVINSISVVVTAPALFDSSTDGSFTIGLGSQLGVGITTGIGAGNLSISPKEGDMTTEEFTFSGLNISLAPGTYYLGMAGGNVEWDYAQPLSTSAGALGLQLACDPFITCGSDITRWDKLTQTYAMEIDGTAAAPAVPEPSVLALFGTGLLGLAGAARRKFLSHS